MITVADLMDLDIFRKRLRLLAGKSGVNKEVTFVTIMEAPDFYE